MGCVLSASSCAAQYRCISVEKRKLLGLAIRCGLRVTVELSFVPACSLTTKVWWRVAHQKTSSSWCAGDRGMVD